MADFKRELFLMALEEWGRYEQIFRELAANEQAAFLKEQGYNSLHDLLAHVGAWWEEARGIIDDVIAHGEGPGREYDLDQFNAATVKRFSEMPDEQLLAWYERERAAMVKLVSGLDEAQIGIRRVQNWLNYVVLEHLKEHGVDAPRFLVIDMLQREWGDYVPRLRNLSDRERSEFLRRQGYVRLQGLLGHIIAWWEQGIAVVEAASSGDGYEIEDVDGFNAEAVKRFGGLDEQEVLARYDDTRLTLANLIDMLPDEVLRRRNVNSWLRADVINHYYEHAN